MKLESLVEKAQNGEKKALEEIVLAIQDQIYYLSLRMLCDQELAKDATQEILILVITKLSTFQFKSKFKTWVYRVSANYLLNTKKLIAKEQGLSFDDFKEDLESDLQEPAELARSPEYQLLLNELRISCTYAMLLCLDQKHRLAYLLGDIFELNQSEASECLSLSKDNYRKQLSRARSKVHEFTSKNCGLISDCAKCSCSKKLTGALKRGRINLDRICFADKSEDDYLQVQQKIKEMSSDLRTLALQTSVPILKNPENFVNTIKELMTS